MTKENAAKKEKTSKYKGVSKPRKKFISQYKRGGVTTYLGSFDNEIEAADAYDKAVFAIEPHKLNKLNFGNPQLPETKEKIAALKLMEPLYIPQDSTSISKKTSIYHGVFWSIDKKAWTVSCRVLKRLKGSSFVGRFATEVEAALAYNEALLTVINDPTQSKISNGWRKKLNIIQDPTPAPKPTQTTESTEKPAPAESIPTPAALPHDTPDSLDDIILLRLAASPPLPEYLTNEEDIPRCLANTPRQGTNLSFDFDAFDLPNFEATPPLSEQETKPVKPILFRPIAIPTPTVVNRHKMPRLFRSNSL